MRYCLVFTSLCPTESVRIYSCLLQALHSSIMLFSLSNLQYISLKLQMHWIIKLCVCLQGITKTKPKKFQAPVASWCFSCIFSVSGLYSFSRPHRLQMELTDNLSSPKLLTYPKYAGLLGAEASKTNSSSSLILECGGMTLLLHLSLLKSFHKEWLHFQLWARQLTDELQNTNKNNQQLSGACITLSNDVQRTKMKYQQHIQWSLDSVKRSSGVRKSYQEILKGEESKFLFLKP